MALKLRKSGGSDVSPQASSSFIETPTTKRTDWYGRLTAPPSRGSSYDEFLMWASSDGLAPLQEEVDLAVTLWMGLEPVDYREVRSHDLASPKM